MLRRLLNIASIVSLVACVALMGMWVRSYYAYDMLTGHFGDTEGIQISSRSGKVVSYLGAPNNGDLTASVIYPWSVESYGIGELRAAALPSSPRGRLDRFGFAEGTTSLGFALLIIPFWFVALLGGTLAMLFQLRWPLRFTLRSMFVFTTFLAIVLGMIAWLDRAWIGK
jgi:hypothetical protein